MYGLPKCLGERHRLCDYVRRLLNYGAYMAWVQRALVQVHINFSILVPATVFKVQRHPSLFAHKSHLHKSIILYKE